MNPKKSAYEGLQNRIRSLTTPPIEVWKNAYPDKIYTITLEIPEFTCICPKTGLPDFAVIKIDYRPLPSRTCANASRPLTVDT